MPHAFAVRHEIRTLRHRVSFAAPLAALLLSGCIVDIASPDFGDGDSHHGTTSITNSPSVSADASSFGFAVLARHFTFDREYATALQTSDARLSLAAAQYGGGSATLEVRDATGAIVHSQQITGNLAQNVSGVHGAPPLRVRVSFSYFSGSFAVSLAPAP